MSKSVLKKCLTLEERIHHDEKAAIKPEKQKNKRKNKNVRSLTDKGQKIQKVDYIEENIKLLTDTDNSIKIKNISELNRGRLLKNQPKILRTRRKKDEPTPTVFTEEDFIKFEQEYFVKGSA